MAELKDLRLNNNQTLESDSLIKFQSLEAFEKHYKYNIPFDELTLKELSTFFKLFVKENGWRIRYYSELAQKTLTINLDSNEIKLEDYGFHILTKKEEEEARAFLEKNYKPPLRPAYHRDSWQWKDLNAELQYDIIKNKVFKDYNKIKTAEDIDNMIFIISQEDYEKEYKAVIMAERQSYWDYYLLYKERGDYLLKIIPVLGYSILLKKELAEFIINHPGCENDYQFLRDFKCIFLQRITQGQLEKALHKAVSKNWKALYLDKESDYASR